MIFFARVGYAFLFIATCDILWIGCNSKWGIYAPVLNTFREGHFFVPAILCWLLGALYAAGHTYSDPATAFGEGAWLGNIIYATFNLTANVIAPTWRSPGTYPYLICVLDTLWGTILFGSVYTLMSEIN